MGRGRRGEGGSLEAVRVDISAVKQQGHTTALWTYHGGVLLMSGGMMGRVARWRMRAHGQLSAFKNSPGRGH